MSKKRMDITVEGKVQGVFFRANAKAMAESLDLTGYAKNQADGTVRIEIEGEQDATHEFLQWTWAGPPPARVDNVTHLEYDELKGFKSFELH